MLNPTISDSRSNSGGASRIWWAGVEVAAEAFASRCRNSWTEINQRSSDSCSLDCGMHHTDRTGCTQISGIVTGLELQKSLRYPSCGGPIVSSSRLSNCLEKIEGQCGPDCESIAAYRQVMNRFRNIPICLAMFLALFISSTAASARESYPNGFPSDASFFPIGVWLQSPAHAPAYKAIGINTFVGLWNGPTEDQLAALANSNMFVVASQNDVGLHSVHGPSLKDGYKTMSLTMPGAAA